MCHWPGELITYLADIGATRSNMDKYLCGTVEIIASIFSQRMPWRESLDNCWAAQKNDYKRPDKMFECLLQKNSFTGKLAKVSL